MKNAEAKMEIPWTVTQGQQAGKKQASRQSVIVECRPVPPPGHRTGVALARDITFPLGLAEKAGVQLTTFQHSQARTVTIMKNREMTKQIQKGPRVYFVLPFS